jgi:hypothetical protein
VVVIKAASYRSVGLLGGLGFQRCRLLGADCDLIFNAKSKSTSRVATPSQTFRLGAWIGRAVGGGATAGLTAGNASANIQMQFDCGAISYFHLAAVASAARFQCGFVVAGAGGT